jgi:hypothetical protein
MLKYKKIPLNFYLNHWLQYRAKIMHWEHCPRSSFILTASPQVVLHSSLIQHPFSRLSNLSYPLSGRVIMPEVSGISCLRGFHSFLVIYMLGISYNCSYVYLFQLYLLLLLHNLIKCHKNEIWMFKDTCFYQEQIH